MQSLTLREQSVLTRIGQTQTADDVALPDAVFEQFRQLAFALSDQYDWLTYVSSKGRETLRIGSYVGVFLLPDGTPVEVLPKIGDTTEQARLALLQMVRYLPELPLRNLPGGRSAATRLPLWDVFVLAFLDTLTVLAQQGLQQSYVSVRRQESFWKGRVRIAEQLRRPAAPVHTMPTEYEHLTTNIAPNRLLKYALSVLEKRTGGATQLAVRTWLWRLDEIPASPHLPHDWQTCRQAGRLFMRYQSALRWAAALLNQQGFGITAGNIQTPTLLFPMARVFESYVAQGIRRYWPDAQGQVRVQESSAYLVEKHVNTPRFRLRPDVLIYLPDGRTVVIDTKWKRLLAHDGNGLYGMEQADLYQLYAYGKKYKARDVFLIYPADAGFTQPLAPFSYETAMRLHVLPFGLGGALAHEVETLANYALRTD